MHHPTPTDRLAELRRQLADYEDLLYGQGDDDAYMARGNGFCDNKYSDDFLEGQIERLRETIAHLGGTPSEPTQDQ